MGIVSFCFDDSLASQIIYGLPPLWAAGKAATFFTITGRLGTAGYMATADINTLYAAGMEIGGHGDTDLVTLGLTDATIDVTAVAAALDLNGWTRGRKLYAYPNGGNDAATRAMVTGLGFQRHRAGNTGRMTTRLYPGPLQGRQVGKVTSQATVKGWIDDCALNDDWLALTYHNLLTGTLSANEDHGVTDFQAEVAYALAKAGVQVKSLGEVLGFYSNAVAAAPTAPTYVGGADSGLSFTNTRTAGAVSGSQAGDLAVAWLVSQYNPSPPDGTWTFVKRITQDTRFVDLYAKVLTTALGATIWTWDNTHNQAVVVEVYRPPSGKTMGLPVAADVISTSDSGVTTLNLALSSRKANGVWSFFAWGGSSDLDWTEGVTNKRHERSNSSHAYESGDTGQPYPGTAAATATYTTASGLDIAAACILAAS